MHKININLHNLKTTLILSLKILQDYSSRHGLRTCQLPSPGCEMGSKDLAFLGLKI